MCVYHPKGAQPAKKKKKEKMEDQSVFASAEEVDDLWVEWNSYTCYTSQHILQGDSTHSYDGSA